MIPKEILKKIRQIELRALRLVNESMAGQYHSVFKGQGMNFEEVREYQPGDEVRCMIGWESLDNTVRLICHQTIQGGEVAPPRRFPDRYAARPYSSTAEKSRSCAASTKATVSSPSASRWSLP